MTARSGAVGRRRATDGPPRGDTLERDAPTPVSGRRQRDATAPPPRPQPSERTALIAHDQVPSNTGPATPPGMVGEVDEAFLPEPTEVPAPPAGMHGEKGPLFRLVRDQRVAFLLVGGINTVVGTLWFVFFQWLVQRWVGYMGVLLCAHVAAVLCAFVLYRTFVFRVRGHVLRDLARFEVVNLTALGVNAVCLPLLVEVAHWPVLVSQLSIVGLTMLVSFFGHRGFSFRRTAADEDRTAARAAGRATR